MAALASLRASAHDFMAWWLGELAGLWPQRLRMGSRSERLRLTLTVTGDEVVLDEPVAEGRCELARTSLSEPDHEVTLQAGLRQARRRPREVTVRLGPGGGLRRMLELPLAARGSVDRLLQFEMDRLTPFRAEQVYVAHRISQVDPAEKRLRVQVQIAPRDTVDRVLALVRALALQAKRVELAEADDGSGPALDLRPDHTPERSRSTHLVRGLALLTLVLTAAAITIPLYRQQSIATRLAGEVEAARVEAQKSLVMRERLDALTASADFVVDAKRARPLVTAIVAELTRVVPDHAHISQLYIEEGTVQLHGLARTASGIIGQLEQSELFRAPRFRSPVTMDPGENLERFHIEVEIQPPAEFVLMPLRPGSLVSRFAAVGLLVLVLLALWTFVVVPLRATYRATAAEIEQSQNLLERYRLLAAQQPELARMVEASETRAGASAAYLEGATEALAGAALQGQVRSLVDAAGGELRSTQILPLEAAADGAPARRIGLRLQLAIDLAGLQELLYGLESTEPFLFLEDVTIRERRMRRRRRDEAEGPPTLDVSFDVYGFLRGLES